MMMMMTMMMLVMIILIITIITLALFSDSISFCATNEQRELHPQTWLQLLIWAATFTKMQRKVHNEHRWPKPTFSWLRDARRLCTALVLTVRLISGGWSLQKAEVGLAWAKSKALKNWAELQVTLQHVLSLTFSCSLVQDFMSLADLESNTLNRHNKVRTEADVSIALRLSCTSYKSLGILMRCGLNECLIHVCSRGRQGQPKRRK